MSELGRVLRQDARRTALLVAVPVLAVAGCLAAWPSLTPGVAYWDDSIVAMLTAARLVGPAAAALAAWAAVRERSLDFLRDLTTRSPATAGLLDLLLLASAAVVAFTAVALVVAAETLTRQEAGRASPLGPLAGASALVLHVVAGYLAGRVLPRRATPFLVLAAAAPWALLRQPGRSWWSMLPPGVYDRVGLFTGLRSEVLADQTVWALGLTAALVLGYAAWLDRRRALVPPLALALLTVGVATVRLHSSGDRVVDPAPTELTCQVWPLEVCVHPALRAALPALTAAFTPLASRLNGTPGAFTRVEQRPAREPAGVAGGVAAVRLEDALTFGYADRAVRQILDGLATAPCTTPGAGQYRALVDAWLAGAVPPPVPDAATARRFASWSEERRRDWLRGHYADYRTCALDAASFPAREPTLDHVLGVQRPVRIMVPRVPVPAVVSRPAPRPAAPAPSRIRRTVHPRGHGGTPRPTVPARRSQAPAPPTPAASASWEDEVQ
ncbi:hypothetical protein [Actinomadura rayongensis]|uniref:hypothetical protein n=1 Tax=Actinomadura rayongensis TaxID=1429076 RepID=UPI0019285837|nr:hypothetical protein [Actinomadura rayongensis]